MKAINVLLLLLLSMCAFSQEKCTYTLSGIVKSSANEILIGASVQLVGSTIGMVTDEEGEYLLSGICAGQYKVVVRYLGYKEKEVDVSVEKNTRLDFALESEAVQLAEVVVSEQQENTDHAKNTSVMTERELQKSAGKSLGESLKELSGVNTIQAGPGIFKPVIHGVHSQRVLILNHGIRQEGQQWGAEHAPEIDQFIASNIVVVKDASSIKYGTDALGGVIIVNPAPLPESAGVGGSVSTVMQTNGRMGAFSGLVEGGIPQQDGWGWRVQGTVKRAGDYHTPTYSLTNTGSKELDFSAAIGVHKENHGLEVFFSRFASDLGILKGTAIGSLEDLKAAMNREPPQYTTGFSYDIEAPKQTVRHNLVKINGHLDSPRGKLRFQYGFQHDARTEYDIRIGEYANDPALDLRLNTHTIEAEWENQVGKNWILCNGATGIFQNNENQYGTKRIPFIPNFVSASWGVYSVSKFNLENWVIDAGIRYDFRYYEVAGYDYKNTLFVEDMNFNNISLTAGATHVMNTSNEISFSLSNAWRPPHVAELYSLGTHQGAGAIEYGLLLDDQSNEVVDISTVDFKNEQALKLVTTYRHRNENLSLEVTGYANLISNYFYLKPTGITTNPRGTFPYFRYTQTDALFLGADLTATQKLSNHFSVIAKSTVLRASDLTNDDYLVFIPPNHYQATIHYETKAGEKGRTCFIEAAVKYTAEQKRAPRVISPDEFITAIDNGEDPLQGKSSSFDFKAAPDAYVLVSASAGLKLPGKHANLDILLTSSNILNTSYRDYTNRFRYYADELGRNISLSFKCTF